MGISPTTFGLEHHGLRRPIPVLVIIVDMLLIIRSLVAILRFRRRPGVPVRP